MDTSAVDLHLRSLRPAARRDDRRAIALAVEGLAGTWANQGDGQQAAVLLGAAAEIQRRAGGSLPSAQELDAGPPPNGSPLSGPAALAAADGR